MTDLTPRNLPRSQTWYFDPHIFGQKIFSGTHPHVIYIIIILYSETRSRTVFFCYHCNRYVNSSKCGPHDFAPPPSQKIVPACQHRISTYVTCQIIDNTGAIDRLQIQILQFTYSKRKQLRPDSWKILR